MPNTSTPTTFAPAACNSLAAFGTPQPNSEVRDNATYGVLKLTLHASSYDWQFIPEAGKTFTDTGTGTCH